MSKLEQRTGNKIWRSRRLYKRAINSKMLLTRWFFQSKFAKEKGYKSYQEYLNSPEWKKKADDYKERFPLCEYCRKKSPVNVHHRNYQNVGYEKYWDLLAVCKDCHDKAHKLLD